MGLEKSSIIETKTEIKDGIKYTTHYVDRPIREGDPMGGPVGMVVNGISKTTEIIQYVYKQKMKQFLNPIKGINYTHYVIFNDERYVREEIMSLKHCSWVTEDKKLIDIHTISWYKFGDETGPIEYFSIKSGWLKGGSFDKICSTPEIEVYFKKTIGKDLIYFI